MVADNFTKESLHHRFRTLRQIGNYGGIANKWLMRALWVEEKSTMLVVVGLAMLDTEGRVLMQQRPPNKQHGGLWEFPGGKVEDGELPCAAIVREIDEELGVAVAERDLFAISFASDIDSSTERGVLLLLYGCRRWAGTIRCEDGAAVAWVETEQLRALPKPPLDVPLAEATIPFLEGVAKESYPY